MTDSLINFPIEIWELIFSWLPLDDQLKFQTICKDWLDLIRKTSSFKSKNCLNLEYATLSADEPPLTLLHNSTLKFGSLKIGKKTCFEPSPSLSSCLAEIGVTITYLDISNISSATCKKFQFFVKYLYLFKVLHHLNIGVISYWLDVAVKLENKNDTAISPNESVRVLSVYDIYQLAELSNEKFGRIQQLLPNVQQFHILPNEQEVQGFNYIDDSVLKFVNAFSDKIVTFTIESKSYDQFKTLNLPMIKNLNIRSYDNKAVKINMEDLLEKFPTLRNVSLRVNALPESYHLHYSGLTLTKFKDLRTLSVFKNLKHLSISTFWKKKCFLDHKPFVLESLQTLKFSFGGGFLYEPMCHECWDTLLQSLPNLKALEYTASIHDSQLYIDSIFKYQANLVELKIEAPQLIISPRWPVMKNLNKLNLEVDVLVGSKQDWDRFGKKMNKLKYLAITYEDCLNVKDIIGNNMPLLQRVEYVDSNADNDENVSEIITRNGKKIIVQTSIAEWDNEDDDDSDDDDFYD